MKFVTYLGFDGKCEEAFRFYEKALGGKISMMMKYKDAPPSAGPSCSPDAADRIMHARMAVGDAVLMGGDAPKERYFKAQGLMVSIQVDKPDEAERVFKALSDGATIQMPLGETFWASRFGMLIDKYGTPWMVNCEKPM